MDAPALYLRQVCAAIRLSFADRANFWLQLGGMAVNNGFILLLWFMFFAGFRSVGGWRLADVALMIGILALTSAGRRLRRRLSRHGGGDPARRGGRAADAATRRAAAAAGAREHRQRVGRRDHRHRPARSLCRVALVAICRCWLSALCGSLAVFLATGVLFASLAFWVRGARSFARDVVDFVILLSSYPGSIYSGVMKVVVYTLVPAGFVVLLPVAVLRAPGLPGAADDGRCLGGIAVAAFWRGCGDIVTAVHRGGFSPHCGGLRCAFPPYAPFSAGCARAGSPCR